MFSHLVRTKTAPRDAWEADFQAQGMHHPYTPMRKLDGLNQGCIDFEHVPAQLLKVITPLASVLRNLVAPLA